MFTDILPPSEPSRDELTGLPDRRALNAALEAAEANHPGAFGVILVDLDGLKQINDTEGHAAGDIYIQKAAEILQGSLRQHTDDRPTDAITKGRPEDNRNKGLDTAGRYAGDEFVIVVTDTSTFDEVQAIRDRLQETLSIHNVEASLGASHHTPGVPVSTLLSQADARMYHDKEMRKIERYTAEQLEIARVIGRLSTENNIAFSDLPALQKFLGETERSLE